MVSWKKVGMGVAAATIGAATFGAVHFMFLAPQYGVGDFMGIPLNVLLPIFVGTLGFIGTYAVGRKWGESVKNIVLFGSSASIGFGVAQYAGWITPAIAPARARAPARAYVPPATARAPTHTVTPSTFMI